MWMRELDRASEGSSVVIETEELAQLDLFRDLSAEILEILADRMDRVSCAREARVYQQGDPGDFFYVVLSGQFIAYREAVWGERQVLYYLSRGEFCGEEALLSGGLYGATVEAVIEGELARMDAETFLGLRKAAPDWAHKVDSIAQARSRFSSLHFPEKEPDEVGLVLEHRHPYALLEALALPLLIAVLCTVVLAALRSAGHLPVAALVILVAALVAALSGWVLWLVVDWRNDHFIVTSKRVIHIERVPLMSEQRTEAAVEKVRSVTSVTPTVGARLWGYKNLVIQTGSTIEPILFTAVGNAEEVGQKILDARDKALARREVEQQREIRQHLRRHMDLPGREEPRELSAEPDLARSNPAPGQTSARARSNRLVRFLAYMTPHMRTQYDEMIVWRRHWYILFRRIVIPAAVTSLFSGALAWSLIRGADLPLARWPVPLAVVLLLYFASWAWFFWRYEDWYNDYYAVTSDQIIDRNSLPFGFQEVRRLATFESVQNVRSDIPNFFYNLLNMGHIYIDIIGGKEAITFDSVYDPSEIQQEIFRRLEAHRQLRAHQEAEQRARELGEWFTAYHVLAQERSAERRTTSATDSGSEPS